ncbi:MAG: sulfur oxidation c-type cytochrome SoxA [Xanthobacteraceae bacterium]|nr:sulfur oxidation c-type cytochrome SoxA [Xanthobacteraceae bacterium]
MTGILCAVRCVMGLLLIGTTLAAGDEIPMSERRSGYDTMSADTKAMQDDDTANPATLWVLEGETLWNTKTASSKSCADCHGDAAQSMKGVAARYPALDTKLNKPIDLGQRINMCRAEHQNATPFAPESRDLLALSAFVARQSRGMPIVQDDPNVRPAIEAGRALFEQRQGQLNLSCAQCHDDNWGKQLAGSVIPQAHPTGYPIYRLEWQSLGSLQRRLRNCLFGQRAELYAFDAPDMVALEAFLMWRARGMPMDAPGVRP